jgi:hypothetical protein
MMAGIEHPPFGYPPGVLPKAPRSRVGVPAGITSEHSAKFWTLADANDLLVRAGFLRQVRSQRELQ